MILSVTGQPEFLVYNADGTAYIVNGTHLKIILPECNSEGQPETSEEQGILTHVNLFGTVTQKPQVLTGAFRIKWTLKYNQRIDGLDVQNIGRLVNLQKKERKLLLFTPYNEYGRQYYVYFSNTTFVMDIQKLGDLSAITESVAMKIDDIELSTNDLHWLDWRTEDLQAAGEPDQVVGGGGET